jgi:cbb3-type cytochrome oxidase subunit 1
MPRVSAAFYFVGVLFVLIGMSLGQYMAAKEDFLFTPVHAHLNLLGWVTMALYGTFYALTKDTYSPRLAWTNFWLSTLSMAAMAPMLALLLKTGDSATWGPRLGIAGGVAMLGLLVFALSVSRELFRKRG